MNVHAVGARSGGGIRFPTAGGRLAAPDSWARRSPPFTFPERVLVVLVRRFAPALYMRWGQGPPHGWTRAFAISQRHPVWSAELLAEAGSSPAVVALARRHQEHFPGPPRDDLERLLLVLPTADELN
jgi:hypothetical protein